MLQVFIDVGAHAGQTLAAAVQYDFDVIYGIEPMPNEFRILRGRFAYDRRVKLMNTALSHSNGTCTMYGTNELMEASILSSKNDVDASATTEVPTTRASEFVGSLPPADVYVKMNCEGAEIPILNDLLDSGAIHSLNRILIDWDIRKVPGMEHTEYQVRDRLGAEGFLRYDDWPPGETHMLRVRQWIQQHASVRWASSPL
jgi:FkbM family methyltransferase